MQNDAPLLPPFDRTRRPAKIADAMWEVVGSYRRPEVAFHPIIDLLIMLLARPVALSFLRKEGEVYRYLHSTMVSSDAETSFGEPLDLVPEHVIEHTHLLRVPPASPGGDSSLYLALCEVKPSPPPRRGQPEMRRRFKLEQYPPTEFDTTKEAPPGGVSFDIWCLERLFAELRSGASMNHEASMQVLAAIHSGASRRPGIVADEGDVGGPAWDKDQHAAWESERARVVSKYWRPMLDGIFPEVTGETPRQRHLSSLEFAAAFRCALPSGHQRAGLYDYTAQLVLSGAQSRTARAFLLSPEFDRRNTTKSHEKWDILRKYERRKEVLTAIERPLGKPFRSIADTPFLSGFADVAPERITDYKRNGPTTLILTAEEEEEYQARKDAEQLILDERGNRSLYVPIHVAGVPFVGIFILHREEVSPAVGDDIWERWYRAYRGQIQIMAARLRAAARQAYTTALGDMLREELVGSDSRDWLDSINTRWRGLSAFFPYELVQLVRKGRGRAGPTQIQLPWNQIADVVLFPNPHVCFRRDKLDHDNMDLFALRDFLIGVAKASTGERLDALALQDAAFAHDVKHWTAPMREDLFAAENAEDVDVVRRRLKRASLHLDLLNACADARQQAVRNRQDPHAPVFGEWMLEEPDKQARVIRAAFELLLHLHAVSVANRTSDLVQLHLDWKKEWDEIGDIFTELKDILPAERRGSDKSLLASPPILWPLGILREVVHNMRILKPVRKIGYCTINIDYTVKKSPEHWGAIELAVTQRSFDQRNLPHNTELRRGIELANTLYGARGAGKGAIGGPQTSSKRITVPMDGGRSIEAFELEYKLPVLFFK